MDTQILSVGTVNFEDKEIIKAWFPVSKNLDGELVGILSDTSMDRDQEFMSKELLEDWGTKTSLKALANHENKMQSWVGGWSDLKLVSKGNHMALTAKPWFFSKEANPLAMMIQKQVEEAIDKGENAGISISAIPLKKGKKVIGEKEFTVYEKAEILEATWVPLQSNRNATYGHIAKQFDLELLNKPKKVEECVEALMNDPDFKPKGGKSKQDSAWAVCQSKFGNKCVLSLAQGIVEIKKEMEDKMENKDINLEDIAVKSAEIKIIDNEKEELKMAVENLKKQIEEMKNRPEPKGMFEGPQATKEIKIEWKPTVENMLKEYLGGGI